jgi:phospholipid transport system substrate-binding protein
MNHRSTISTGSVVLKAALRGLTGLMRVAVLTSAATTAAYAAKTLSSMPLAPLSAASEPKFVAELPNEQIARVAKDLLAHMEADKKAQKGEIGALKGMVDRIVMPVVDMAKMTGAAVGPAWRRASPEQRTTLQEEFKTLVVRTYAGALTQAKGAVVDVKPIRPEEMKALTTASTWIVRSQVKTPAGQLINLDYRLIPSTVDGKQKWYVVDVNVGGVWLTQNYRPQFAEEANAKGLDGLIASLKAKNQGVQGAPR